MSAKWALIGSSDPAFRLMARRAISLREGWRLVEVAGLQEALDVLRAEATPPVWAIVDFDLRYTAGAEWDGSWATYLWFTLRSPGVKARTVMAGYNPAFHRVDATRFNAPRETLGDMQRLSSFLYTGR